MDLIVFFLTVLIGFTNELKISGDNSTFRGKRQYQGPMYRPQQPQWTSPSIPSAYPPVICPVNNPAWNKLIAMQLAQDITDLNPSNLHKYVATDYIQHDPRRADGLQALRDSLGPGGAIWQEYGGRPGSFNFEHVGAADNYVWIHAKTITATGKIAAIFVLDRFECGLAKEHWCVYQAIDPSQPVYNPHPYF